MTSEPNETETPQPNPDKFNWRKGCLYTFVTFIVLALLVFGTCLIAISNDQPY